MPSNRPDINRLREIVSRVSGEAERAEANAIIDNIGAPTDERLILGDWRDQRRAMEIALKDFPQFGAHINSGELCIPDLWEFVKVILKNYSPLKYRQTCLGCPPGYPTHDYRVMYRCWDCKAWLCEQHALRHMGPNHIPHK